MTSRLVMLRTRRLVPFDEFRSCWLGRQVNHIIIPSNHADSCEHLSVLRAIGHLVEGMPFHFPKNNAMEGNPGDVESLSLAVRNYLANPRPLGANSGNR